MSTMNPSSFDPAEAVTFDLSFGHVHLDGAPNRVLVPADALMTLCGAAGEDEASGLGHAIGEALGRRVAVRLSGGSQERHEAARKASFEQVVTQLAGELALVGLGALSAERWGRSVVMVVDQSPLGEAGDELLAAVLQSAFKAMVDRPARMVRLERDGVRVRYLVCSGAVVQAVRDRLAAGENWGAVVASLHAERKSA
jgi:hypothetical protein